MAIAYEIGAGIQGSRYESLTRHAGPPAGWGERVYCIRIRFKDLAPNGNETNQRSALNMVCCIILLPQIKIFKQKTNLSTLFTRYLKSVNSCFWALIVFSIIF